MNNTNVNPVHYPVYRSLVYINPIKITILYGAPKNTAILFDLDLMQYVQERCDEGSVRKMTYEVKCDKDVTMLVM